MLVNDFATRRLPEMTGSIGIVERMRWTSALLASAMLTVVVAVALHYVGTASPGSATGGGSTTTLDPRIAALAARQPGHGVEAIVQFGAGVTQAQATADSARVHARVVGRLHIINALALRLTAAQARTLAADPGVHAVSLNTAITPEGGPIADAGALTGNLLSSSYDRTLGVTPLWRFGLTGSGVGVAVVDTGVDGALPDFRSADDGHSRVVETAVTNQGATTVQDTYGHGTDVAGIIAGDGANRDPSDPLRGQYVGVAPDANLISVKVADDSGRATVLDVIYGLQFVVDHQRDYNIRVVNLSLDSTTPQSYKTDPLDAAAESAWMHGIVVVASAGNRGTAADAVQFAPANDPYVITVGAVDDRGTPRTGDDTVASFSSRGLTQDGFAKPDIYAPGTHILSVLAPNSTFSTMCPACVVGGEYIRTSGTSMAAPMISGLVADLLQEHPSWTPDQVKGALTSRFAKARASVPEVNGVRLALIPEPPVANRGLQPNALIADASGNINYNLSSWSLSSWSVAKGSLSAGFALSSWSCASCGGGDNGGVDPTMSSWSMSSWSTYLDQ
jgi:serine protease AprX